MKNENIILISLLAVIGFFLWQGRKKTAQPQPLPTQANLAATPAAIDYIQLARNTLDWAAQQFGGFGKDKALPQ